MCCCSCFVSSIRCVLSVFVRSDPIIYSDSLFVALVALFEMPTAALCVALLAAFLLVGSSAAAVAETTTVQQKHLASMGSVLQRMRQQPNGRWSGNAVAGLVKDARQHYDAATRLAPQDPKPHSIFAMVLLAAKQFDEASEKMDHFEELLSRLNGNSKEYEGMRMTARHMREEWKSSKARHEVDEVYQEGRGNYTEALAATLRLKALGTRDIADVTHRAAILKFMLCEQNASLCSEALNELKEAASHAMWRYLDEGLPHIPLDAKHAACGGEIRHAGASNVHRLGCHDPHDPLPSIVIKPLRRGARLVEINSDVLVMGRDGVMGFTGYNDKNVCHLCVPHYYYLANVEANVLRHSDPSARRRLSPKLLRQPESSSGSPAIVSLVSFASGSYYHWMCESLPSLILLRESADGAKLLRDASSTVSFLLPTIDKKIPRFVSESVKAVMVGGALFKEVAHVHQVSDTVVIGGLRMVSFGDEDACEVSHCRLAVAPPSALLATNAWIRREVVKGALPTSASHLHVIVVGRGREGSAARSRQHDEAQLVNYLEARVDAHEGIKNSGWNISVTYFQNSSGSWVKDLELFSTAQVIVGVHGGALANIVACAATPLTSVIEIGFKSCTAEMYQHVAVSLDMHYERVLVTPDPLSRGVAAPTIEYDVNEVVNAVISRLVILVAQVQQRSDANGDL